mmetsp:Transcript_21782/g.16124  ORF Transcript_21782/g.16124 Transcript_21782/m.16124 type:complete len:104 (+) Transcript_21782:498-809(+)|eukprot:CAMPEP_0202980032 /NCGR_PEP_ID=MMETSP1396-20130829/86029_1 /ASSEMBLY_ACC=CAM_ASM_000872 /TAXON_ID= /ORGANISM="Pseudokeronopsis sp., Strain Brazil" /LENGTH=103 /DNA_ID=CAMNT_0049719747 /DNA_START=2208 /DNA_END=2519 /DNA_ORIENTATION=+
MLGIDDKAIEYNKHATVAKRNYAPGYKNVDSLLEDIQAKIDQLLRRKEAIDRLSMAKGVDKYESVAYQKRNQMLNDSRNPQNITHKKKIVNNFNNSQSGLKPT